MTDNGVVEVLFATKPFHFHGEHFDNKLELTNRIPFENSTPFPKILDPHKYHKATQGISVESAFSLHVSGLISAPTSSTAL